MKKQRAMIKRKVERERERVGDIESDEFKDG